MSVAFGGRARETVGMHLAADEIRVAAVSRDGDSMVVDALPAGVHQTDSDVPTAVESRRFSRAGRRTDVLARLGERAFVPLHDTWFPADHLVRVLLVAARETAQTLCARTLDRVVLAHPARWDERCLRLLRRCVDAAGFVQVDLVMAAEAGAWAVTRDAVPTAGGLTLVFDMDDDVSVALTERTRSGQRLLAGASRGSRTPGVAADALLRSVGCSFDHIGEAWAVGSGATDAAATSAVAREIGRPVRVVGDPRGAVAVGALLRTTGRMGT